MTGAPTDRGPASPVRAGACRPRWDVTLGGIQPTAEVVPDFPLARYDAGAFVYQEALLDGQLLGAHLSAMGRAKPRWWVWGDLREGATSDRPLRSRQHAFVLEADGQLLVEGWELVETGGDERHAVLTLLHPARGLRVEVHTRLDDTPFLSRHLVVTNVGTRPVALAQVQPWAGMVFQLGPSPWDAVNLGEYETGPFSVGRMTDSSAGNEGSFAWMPVPPGGWTSESLHGRSGWGVPAVFVRNDATGELLVLDLAWSGNWKIELHNDWEPGLGVHRAPDARLYASVGLAGPAPLRVLQPQESATSPAVHLALVFGGLDEAVQALHTHIRTSVTPAQPAGREHRVEINHTAFTRNAQVTQDQLDDEIDLAAELGFELFMLDAGWFGGADSHWARTVGDWDESPLLRDGVAGSLDRVRDRGMLAGLWVEPERVGADSRLAREHPEWLMTRRGQRIFNLDLSKPEVAEHTEQLVVGLIERYRLDCFRIDYNVNIGEGGSAAVAGYTENVLWRHYDALYAIFERVRDRFPDLLLENCSSGGGRMDLGMMSRFHWTQLTDRWSPGPSVRIMNGATLVLPPELTESVMGGISEGVADVDFLIRANLFRHFNVSGIAPSRAERNEATWERWRHGIRLYKEVVRPMLSTARSFHHTPLQDQRGRGEWVVLESAAAERDRAMLGVFRLLGAADDDLVVRPRGLDAGRRYRVRLDSAGSEREVDGDRLADEGVRVRVSSPLRSELVLVEPA